MRIQSVWKLPLLVLVCVAVCVAAPSAYANPIELVVNGEFETPTNTSIFQFHPNATVPGWTSTSGPGDIEFFVQGFISPSIGSDGAGTGQHLEITRNSATETVSQSFVVPAALFQADFSFDAWPRSAAGVFVNVTGTSSGTLVNASPSLAGLGSVWTPFNFNNLAITPGETITITFQSVGGGGAGAHVDQVSFLATPEPTSLIIFGMLTMGAAGYVGLRRRKKIAQ